VQFHSTVRLAPMQVNGDARNRDVRDDQGESNNGEPVPAGETERQEIDQLFQFSIL
jgi:hypothetical protein